MSIRGGERGNRRISKSIKSIKKGPHPHRQFSLALVFASIFIFYSCSSPSIAKIDLPKLWKQVCFNGEGRGKITLTRGSYYFSYQSILQENRFSLALDFPFIPEELLHLDFNKLYHGERVKIEGSLFERLKEWAKDNYKSDPFSPSLASLGRFMAFLMKYGHSPPCSFRESGENITGICNAQGVLKNPWHFHYSYAKEQFKIFSPQIILSNSRPTDDGYFSRQTITIHITKEEVIEIHLYISSCTG